MDDLDPCPNPPPAALKDTANPPKCPLEKTRCLFLSRGHTLVCCPLGTDCAEILPGECTNQQGWVTSAAYVQCRAGAADEDTLHSGVRDGHIDNLSMQVGHYEFGEAGCCPRGYECFGARCVMTKEERARLAAEKQETVATESITTPPAAVMTASPANATVPVPVQTVTVGTFVAGPSSTFMTTTTSSQSSTGAPASPGGGRHNGMDAQEPVRLSTGAVIGMSAGAGVLMLAFLLLIAWASARRRAGETAAERVSRREAGRREKARQRLKASIHLIPLENWGRG